MKATLMGGAGDVRVQDVPDPVIQAPTDAIVRMVRAAICGSDLHPYRSMPATDQGRQMGHEFLGIVEDTGTDVTGLKRGDFVLHLRRQHLLPVPSGPADLLPARWTLRLRRRRRRPGRGGAGSPRLPGPW
jgi:NADPH:quinone reductase-like Zn-dependent oxidoreductase